MPLAAPSLGIEQAAAQPHTLSATVLQTAAIFSASAGLIHAAAAGGHAGDRTLAVLFAIAAALQLGWAFLGFTYPREWVRWAGIVLHAGAAGFWAVTRTAGFEPIGDLAERQPAEAQDLIALGFAVAAVVAAFAAGLRHNPKPANRKLTTVAAVGALALVIPGATIRHDHTHAAADTAIGAVYMTAGQKAAGDDLVARTKAAMQQFATTDAAAAAGYESIGDALTGWEHWVNAPMLADGKDLDPSAIESLVYQVDRTTRVRTIASAMYILPTGTTMAEVPNTIGPSELWHDHRNLCWDASGRHIAGVLRPNGTCFPGGTFRATAPMLHVWVIPNACNDPFAGVDTGAAVDCTHGHAHDSAATPSS